MQGKLLRYFAVGFQYAVRHPEVPDTLLVMRFWTLVSFVHTKQPWRHEISAPHCDVQIDTALRSS